jgi:hypothetical protein
MSRSIRMLAGVTLALTALATSAQAQTPAIDPGALKALDAMSTYLRGLKTFQVHAATATDEVDDDGQLITNSASTMYVVAMPNRLAANVSSDRNERSYFYDGKSFTLLARRVGYYATVPAPATLRELDDLLLDTYGIELPLADLFRWGSVRFNESGITSARDIGPGEAGGVTCQRYLFRQQGVDWQIWIQKGDHPLPRRMVITTTSDPARPRYAAAYTWNLAPSFNDAAFTFVPPAGASKIVLATVDQQ